MSALQRIRQLAQGLIKSEIDYVQNYLNAFDSRGEKHENKSLKLFNIVRLASNNDLSEAEVIFQIYGSRKDQGNFSRLLFRLRDKIYDVISNDTHVQKGEIFSEKVYTRIKLRRKLNYCDVLLSRNFIELADVVLAGTEEQAVDFELFDELLAVLRLQYDIAFRENNFTEANKLAKKIALCRRRIFVIETARQLYLYALLPNAMDLKPRAAELQTFIKESPSFTAEMYLTGIFIEMERVKGNFNSEGRLLRKQFAFISNNKALNQPMAKIEVLKKQCLNNIFLKRFDSANAAIIQADEILTAARITPDWSFHNTRFHAYLYAGKMQMLEDCIKQYTGEDFRVNWIYYSAVTFFIAEKYEDAFELLSKISMLECYKAGLGNWPKLLQIMALITQTVQLDMKLEKRLLERLHSRLYPDEMGFREQTANTMLKAIVSNHLSFKKVLQGFQSEYEQLQSENPYKRWEVMSPELIPFDDWFSTMLSKSYLLKNMNFKR